MIYSQSMKAEVWRLKTIFWSLVLIIGLYYFVFLRHWLLFLWSLHGCFASSRFATLKLKIACKNSRLERFARRGEGSSRRQFSQATLKSVINSRMRVNWGNSRVGSYFTSSLDLYKARFRRRTFHEPNLIRIKTDPNYLDRLKWFRRRS